MVFGCREKWYGGAGMSERGPSNACLLINVLILMYKSLAKIDKIFQVLYRISRTCVPLPLPDSSTKRLLRGLLLFSHCTSSNRVGGEKCWSVLKVVVDGSTFVQSLVSGAEVAPWHETEIASFSESLIGLRAWNRNTTHHS